jgi:hypothetical protein
MPGGATGQLLSLQQGDVTPTQSGQVPGYGAADDAATDNDNTGMFREHCYLITPVPYDSIFKNI